MTAKKAIAGKRAQQSTPKSTVKRAKPTTQRAKSTTATHVADDLSFALGWLEKNGSKKTRDELAPRYGIVVTKAFGVSMANMKLLAKRLGTSHQLADALWKSGWYEARMVACMVDDSAMVTTAQMDRWCKDFDNWGICDTVCFKLFDHAPQAWTMAKKWCTRQSEFEKRAGFSLLACIALHDKECDDAPFVAALSFVEREAGDDRNFVKKSVNWALRAIGLRNTKLKAASLAVARRLSESANASARWNGRAALNALNRTSRHAK